VAFEDVGCGDVGAVVDVAALLSARARRTTFETDGDAIEYAVRRLSGATKERGADYLFSIVTMGSIETSGAPRSAAVKEVAASLYHEAAALWRELDARSDAYKRWRFNCTDAVTERFSDWGISSDLIGVTHLAARKIGHPFVFLVPLLLARLGPAGSAKACPLPSTIWSLGVPTYAFDMHTRIGKAAIAKFMLDCDEVRSCLAELFPVRRWKEASELAAFYADAAPVASLLEWELGNEIRNEAIRVEFARIGVLSDRHQILLDVVLRNLQMLNLIRCDVNERAHSNIHALCDPK
jgi:hypothetical protein